VVSKPQLLYTAGFQQESLSAEMGNPVRLGAAGFLMARFRSAI
jgi:hypothetical protein